MRDETAHAFECSGFMTISNAKPRPSESRGERVHNDGGGCRLKPRVEKKNVTSHESLPA